MKIQKIYDYIKEILENKNNFIIDSEFNDSIYNKSDFHLRIEDDLIYLFNYHNEDDYYIELSDNEIKIYQFLDDEDYFIINDSLDDIINKEINLINK